ncbi:MAG: alpha/beta hydrolase [Cytophagales bacterium]|nr:MAG: alpha/beta hydrolase [Cytophagales bacterium]
MNKFLKYTLVGVAVIGVTYLAGPRPSPDPATDTPVSLATTNLADLDQTIAREEGAAGLKPDNEARIVWADSNRKAKTPYSIVYIPGFGASWAEGDPINRNIARAFGCNLYLARTAEHGLKSPDALKNLTPANFTASAERALAIGKAIGEKVIVMGTSAGGMLTLYLGQRHPEIHSLIIYSPCIAVANPGLKLATRPWGKQLLDKIMGGEHVNITHYKPDRAQYWLTRYHTNGLITLQTMIDTYMKPEEFAKVKQPLFVGYYYKDEENQDKVVSVAAMLDMYEQLGTPANLKRKVAFPNAGEHVIASHFTSTDLAGVERETRTFMQEVLKLPLAAPTSPILASIPKK